VRAAHRANAASSAALSNVPARAGDRISGHRVGSGDAFRRDLAAEPVEIPHLAGQAVTIRKVLSAMRVTVTTRGYEALGNINDLELNLRRKPFDDVRWRLGTVFGSTSDGHPKSPAAHG
jgi:hypothetical protein